MVVTMTYFEQKQNKQTSLQMNWSRTPRKGRKEGKGSREGHSTGIPRRVHLGTEETVMLGFSNTRLVSIARCPHICKDCLFPTTH